ncbi:MAG: sodium:proton antiporter NhaD [Saprospiraceae bacterium]|nr:sodium:proton antiporter NhaD [Saprospiraceae bacterium]
MYLIIGLVFILGYAFIAFEHPLRINKAASALLMAVALWTLLIIGGDSFVEAGAIDPAHKWVESHLMEHLSSIGGILFFLLGAMTIVEIVDSHGGFEIITRHIQTTSQSKLLWILSITTFFMSAALDNMTTAIVMSTLLRKLIRDNHDIWFFGGMIIIAANAGGAWSPIGDVTTIMLWIGGQITAANIVLKLFIPSLLCLLFPLIIISLQRKGGLVERPKDSPLLSDGNGVNTREKSLVFYLGTGALLFVPVFKTITNLPPFMGILLGVGVLWVVTEIMHRHKGEELRKPLSISGVLQRIDTPSILFFLGILLAVAALETAGHLGDIAQALNQQIGNIWVINTLIGLLSAIVDNVPLVAGAMGMYSLSDFPTDHPFWELLAYCAGTGGSILIIGSAAGVATMGILKIEFIWYMKKIAIWAALGYFAGILCYYAIEHFLF